MGVNKSCKELETKVIEKGYCTLCGACTGLCPYFTAYQGRILLKDSCEICEGACQAFCPATSVNLDYLSQGIFGVPYVWNEVGTLQKVIMARSTKPEVRAKAQNAGVVTALMSFALEQGFIDTAVLTHFKDRAWPEGLMVTNSNEVENCSGSSYMAAPTLQIFNKTIRDDSRQSIGFVGTPCQVTALAKMRTARSHVSKNVYKLKLVIGLFCTWALSYPETAQLLGKKVSGDIVKYDIPPHPANALLAYTKNECINISLDEVLPLVRPACRLCLDLTAEYADISVGSGRGKVLDWNTLIIRTDRGKTLIESAIEKGVIQTVAIPTENLTHLKAAALNKKRKALGNIIQITGGKEDLLYLKAQPELVKQMFGE